MRNLPELPSHKGQTKVWKDIEGKEVSFSIEDEIVQQEKGYPEKAIYLQKLRRKNGEIMFRFCYFMIGVKPKGKGKWTYGQGALVISPEDLKAILKKAEKWKYESK